MTELMPTPSRDSGLLQCAPGRPSPTQPSASSTRTNGATAAHRGATPLLADGATSSSVSSRAARDAPARVPYNFLKMSLFFSVNHGCVVVQVSLTSVLLGDNGSYQNASLFIVYALTALLISAVSIDTYGVRKVLIAACFAYCVYVITVPIALVVPDEDGGTELAVALAGGIIGGLASGHSWVAQAYIIA